MDGNGYPFGLSTPEIPLESRILAVADSSEVMTADRPYRVGMSVQMAQRELVRCAGSQFDPGVVRAFLDTLGDTHPGPGELPTAA